MRAVLLAAGALLLAQPALAKMWADSACHIAVSTEGERGFTVVRTDGSYRAVCEISHWPIKNPVAVMKCDDGSEPEMELIGEEQMKFAGHMLTLVTDQNGLCD